MQQTDEGKRSKPFSGTQGLPKKKMRKVGQFLFSSNLLDLGKQKIGELEDQQEVRTERVTESGQFVSIFFKVLEEGQLQKMQDQFPENKPLVISNLEQIKQITRKRNTKTKCFPPLEEDWILFCKLAMITNWRGHVRFFLVDQNGHQVKCQLQKEAANRGFRQILKIGKYYLVSKGVASIDKESNLFFSFYKNAKFVPTVSAFFKINSLSTLRIHQLYEKSILSKVNVIGVIKNVKLCNQQKSDIGKIMNQIILCDPITRFQVQVKRLVISPQQKTLSEGLVLILHGFVVLERVQNTIGLGSNLESYHTVQQDTRDEIVLGYIKAVSNLSWKTAKYSSVIKHQFSHCTLKTLNNTPVNLAKRPLFSILDGHIIRILVGKPILEIGLADQEVKLQNENKNEQLKKQVQVEVVKSDDEIQQIRKMQCLGGGNPNIEIIDVQKVTTTTQKKQQISNKPEQIIELPSSNQIVQNINIQKNTINQNKQQISNKPEQIIELPSNNQIVQNITIQKNTINEKKQQISNQPEQIIELPKNINQIENINIQKTVITQKKEQIKNKPQQTIIKGQQKTIYDLIVVFDDDTARTDVKMSWRLLSLLVDIKQEHYIKLCQKKTQLQNYLKKIKKNRVRLKIKSTFTQEGQFQHQVQGIECLTRTLNGF